jgi:hypothetical protein
LNSISNPSRTGAAFLLLVLTACGGASDVTSVTPPVAPSIISSSPVQGATGAFVNWPVSATFSEPMAAGSLTATTFTLTSGAATVPGTVSYANARATFWPTAQLAGNTSYTATITTGATSSGGRPLAAPRAWSFTTGTTVAPGVPGLPIDLGTAITYAILAKSGISTATASSITGDIGVSPIAATAITGFSLAADASNVFSISTQVSGRVYAADYAAPTPTTLITAVGDMEAAFTAAAGRTPGFTEESSGNIGGQTLVPGVHKWSTGVSIATDLTLSGSATDVWIFQIAQGLDLANGVRVTLAGGALARNVFWQVSGAVTVGTTAHLEGIVLGQTAVTLASGASVNGRLLAQTAVTLIASSVVQPAP